MLLRVGRRHRPLPTLGVLEGDVEELKKAEPAADISTLMAGMSTNSPYSAPTRRDRRPSREHSGQRPRGGSGLEGSSARRAGEDSVSGRLFGPSAPVHGYGRLTDSIKRPRMKGRSSIRGCFVGG